MSKKILFLLVGLFIFASLGSALFFYYKYQKTLKVLKDPKELEKLETKLLVEKIGKLIELPGDEIPTVATVSDKEKLRNQPFFAKAQNGDKVLIYTKTKKAVLYRSSTNKIIEVGPVNIGESSPSATESSAVSPAKPALIKIAIYNASETVGLASRTEEKLKGKFNNISVVDKDNSKGNYDKTLVADLTGKRKELVSDMAKFLEGEVGSFPLAEDRPEADVLVIVVEQLSEDNLLSPSPNL